jgi:hypothetical protein
VPRGRLLRKEPATRPVEVELVEGRPTSPVRASEVTVPSPYPSFRSVVLGLLAAGVEPLIARTLCCEGDDPSSYLIRPGFHDCSGY